MKHSGKKTYNLLEVTLAIFLASVLATCVIAVMNSLNTMERMYAMESRAVLVLDNTLHRLEARDSFTADDTRKVFADELKKSGLGETTGVSSEVVTRDNEIVLYFRYKETHPLAELRIKPKGGAKR